MPRIVILVVDDSPDMRQLLKSILQTEHAHILLANDGLEAISVVRRLGNHIDLILTDVNMPRLDGITFANAVSDFDPQIPIVFVSSSLDRGGLKQRETIQFVQKPFLPQTLLKTVREVMSGRKHDAGKRSKQIA